ncbi:helix-turn-helix transcriptional regulator [Micromonospora sp. NPDC004704]
MDPRAELSEFLRSRRARLRPEDTGLPVFGGRRRVPGLRREELAQLAGVSVDYYVRLEQGRLGNVSESILNAVAVALRLDDAERTHLYNLARPAQRHRPQQRHSGNREQVRPSQQWLLDALYEVPAYILGRRLDVIAWNDQASALLSVDLDALAPEERNMARLIFLDETARDLWGNWTQKARDTLGGLRMHAGLFPDDPLMAQLVGELSLKSTEFRQWWADHDVWVKPHGTMHFHHPIVGEFSLAYEALAVPDAPEQTLVTYTAQPGSAAHTALRLLATWHADSRDRQKAPPMSEPS